MSSNEYHREYNIRRYHTRRQRAIEQLGGKCVDCGSTTELEFDHTVREDKLFDSKRWMNVSLEKFQAEIEKCVLRCAPCHRIRTSEQLGVEHGGGISGKRNCKCEPCRERKREYMRNYKRNRKETVVGSSPMSSTKPYSPFVNSEGLFCSTNPQPRRYTHEHMLR